MKFSEQWLREWVNPPISTADLCQQLTLAGLEVDAVHTAAKKISQVVVARVLKIEPHPNADKLQICTVDVGNGAPLTIVCGAKNVFINMVTAAALPGAILPGDKVIQAAIVRGIASAGMLCSLTELGLENKAEGIAHFPDTAPLGMPVWDYLKLDDTIIDVAITPNRGDCLSILGIAREVAALNSESELQPLSSHPIAPSINEVLPLSVKANEACPRYLGRIIKNINNKITTPIWLQERLRRAGIRCINPAVDVTNYVMLELGQPMHAFALSSIHKGIIVRFANENEKIKLLDGQEVNLQHNTLIIADHEKPLALAGVMGGLDSSVNNETTSIYLESAFFTPSVIIQQARTYHLHSESSYRFERSINPELQHQAMERATELLLQITGGEAGPIIEETSRVHLPQKSIINLRLARIEKILGITIAADEIHTILQKLNFHIQRFDQRWEIIAPSYRADITEEIDIIEEIARLKGYAEIPLATPRAPLKMQNNSEAQAIKAFRQNLVNLNYHEIISYSFVDEKLQQKITPQFTAKPLMNPMSLDMAVMRTSLWPGLLNTLLYNQKRQQTRARFFEIGLRFIPQPEQVLQEKMLSGLAWGNITDKQWGKPEQIADFYTVKGDIETLLQQAKIPSVLFKPHHHPALHPGQCAEIFSGHTSLGVIGVLHPALSQSLEIPGKVVLFELAAAKLLNQSGGAPIYTNVAKFPEIRRDLALIVEEAIPMQQIQDTIKLVGGEYLTAIGLFDVYQGKGIRSGHKSLAFSLTFQHPSRTLVDEEVVQMLEHIILSLKQQYAIELRS